MSSTPYFKQTSLPKKVSQSKDYKLMEHGRLLKKVYTHLEPIVKAIFAVSEEEHIRRVQEAVANCHEGIGELIETKGREAKATRNPQACTALMDAIGVLQSQFALPIPEISQSVWDSELVDHTVAYEILDENTGRAYGARPKTFGYVDLVLTVKGKSGIILQNDKPPMSPFGDDFDENDVRDIQSWVQRGSNPHEWFEVPCSTNLWVDIRVEMPPVGQLLRELKLLQSYAERSRVMLITRECDEFTQRMLRNEGFDVLTESDIDLVVEPS